MSDDYVQTGLRSTLIKNSISYWIGWSMFMIALCASAIGGKAKIFVFIGWGILGLPKIIAALKGGFGAAFSPTFEEVTVERSTGRVVSRGQGAESGTMNMAVYALAGGAMYVLGGVVALFHMAILSVKCLVKGIAIPVIIINIAVFIGAIVAGGITQGILGDKVMAARGIKKTSDYNYLVNGEEDGIILNYYRGYKHGKITLPTEIDGLPVVGIVKTFDERGNPPWGDGRVKRQKRITSVAIPDTVTYIEAFIYGCEDVKQITLPENLKIIGQDAFRESGLTSIIIPEGVTDIGKDAFKNCANLTSITLPKSLKRVGENAFEKCTSLVDVKIASGSSIMYGYYAKAREADSDIHIEAMDKYFQNNKQSVYEDLGSFKDCSKLSAASQQAVKDSGYKGKF
ncbi:MAG: leucine-rich repeat domain-containing protein [Treponema sp.]|jgi:hypothetical protein|nr:leucine-rich repeat domain-containing protein [Treponema sp.]